MLKLHALAVPSALAAILWGGAISAQTNGQPEEFSATAIVNNNLGAGAGRVIMRVERWSTEAQRGQLTRVLMKDGPNELLDQLRDQKSVGTIRTPDSLGYDLRYAHQEAGEDGGRRVVIATDRPIGFWEAVHQPRTIDYPFTVIDMRINREGVGEGKMSLATKITASKDKKQVELENYGTQPVLLQSIKREAVR